MEPEQVSVEILPVQLVSESEVSESELDEMWSFVQKKANQRWLWHAINHQTGVVLFNPVGLTAIFVGTYLAQR